MRAHYGYADDRLTWWPGRALSPAEAAAAQRAGFRSGAAPGVWLARWSLAAEAHLHAAGVARIGEDRRFPEAVATAQVRAAIVQHQLRAHRSGGREREHAERRVRWLVERLLRVPLPPLPMVGVHHG